MTRRERSRKSPRFRSDLPLRENAVSDPGKKVIYLRLLNPDNVALANTAGDMFTYNGENIVYSEKRDIEYENKDIDVNIFWNKTEELKPGELYRRIVFRRLRDRLSLLYP